MRGIEISERYFAEFGLPMLQEQFPDLLPFLAAGFTGSGSEHYGFDDGVSRDHDFEAGFCLFLPDEETVDRKRAFELERAYAKLPGEYLGVRRPLVAPVGGNRNGVFRTAEYFLRAAGTPDGQLSVEAWLHIPDYALAEAVNGKIFFDNYGEVTRIRERLSAMPEDIRRKRLAGTLLVMAQAGQYNFGRCLSHGEPEAAQLACNEFVNASIRAFLLLKGKYMPYYKWSFRALRLAETGTLFSDRLAVLLHGDNSDPAVADMKCCLIEDTAADIVSMLKEQGLSEAVCGDLEKHAYSVNDGIADPLVRNLNILETV